MGCAACVIECLFAWHQVDASLGGMGMWAAQNQQRTPGQGADMYAQQQWGATPQMPSYQQTGYATSATYGATSKFSTPASHTTPHHTEHPSRSFHAFRTHAVLVSHVLLVPTQLPAHPQSAWSTLPGRGCAAPAPTSTGPCAPSATAATPPSPRTPPSVMLTCTLECITSSACSWCSNCGSLRSKLFLMNTHVSLPPLAPLHHTQHTQ